MPFRSEKQRRWMWANKPEMARRWTSEYGSEPKTKLLKLSARAAEFAAGIPEKGRISSLPKVTKPMVWEFSAHPHEAEKAGPHIDMRLGDPETGIAHSFVLPKSKLPEPGKAVQVIPTNDHTIPYMDFKGEIGEGYGKGTVRSGRRTKAEVYHTEADDAPGTKLRFNLYDEDHPQEYAIVKGAKNLHLLVNKTQTRERRPDIPAAKPKYKEFDIKELDVTRDQVMMPKLDGAHTLIDLTAGRSPRLYSYRIGKKSSTGLIEHTHKMPDLLKVKVPKQLDGTILRGETLAVDDSGKAIPAEQIAGLLNAKVWDSRSRQIEKGVRLKAFPFQVERYRGKDMTGSSFAEQEKILRDVAAAIPDLSIPEIARTPTEKLDLANRIKANKHPLTREGVVLTTPGRAPQRFHKGKVTPDFDVFVRDVIPAAKKGGGFHDRAGAISYSWDPTGPIIGQLGGFKHDEAKQMLANPEQYKGRVAKVKAMRVFDGDKPGQLGALFQPRFSEWHLDKGDIEKQATRAGFLDELEKIAAEDPFLQRAEAIRSAIAKDLRVSESKPFLTGSMALGLNIPGKADYDYGVPIKSKREYRRVLGYLEKSPDWTASKYNKGKSDYMVYQGKIGKDPVDVALLYGPKGDFQRYALEAANRNLTPEARAKIIARKKLVKLPFVPKFVERHVKRTMDARLGLPRFNKNVLDWLPDKEKAALSTKQLTRSDVFGHRTNNLNPIIESGKLLSAVQAARLGLLKDYETGSGAGVNARERSAELPSKLRSEVFLTKGLLPPSESYGRYGVMLRKTKIDPSRYLNRIPEEYTTKDINSKLTFVVPEEEKSVWQKKYPTRTIIGESEVPEQKRIPGVSYLTLATRLLRGPKFSQEVEEI